MTSNGLSWPTLRFLGRLVPVGLCSKRWNTNSMIFSARVDLGHITATSKRFSSPLCQHLLKFVTFSNRRKSNPPQSEAYDNKWGVMMDDDGVTSL